jgi:hypothetical protein
MVPIKDSSSEYSPPPFVKKPVTKLNRTSTGIKRHITKQNSKFIESDEDGNVAIPERL